MSMVRDSEGQPVIATQTRGGGQLMAKQAMRDDCDVNLIVKRHAQTGMWSHLNPTEPTYGDASQAVELQLAIAIVEDAENSFMELPADVRRLCNNDPVEFAEHCADQAQYHELVAAGLVPGDTYKPPVEPEPAPEPAAPEPPVTPQGGE